MRCEREGGKAGPMFRTRIEDELKQSNVLLCRALLYKLYDLN